jgi:4-amino-4-deoxy-L-arabinose transferase-like glycosyltransferase
MFGALAALLAGLVLVSSVSFCAAAHFANPDALLTAFSALTLTLFWCDCSRGGRSWWFWCGLSSGVAVLAKGPVGLLLPGAVVFCFLLWQGQLRRLLDVRLALGILAFLVVAAPWYVWVGLETKGLWLLGFWRTHNQNRFLAAMENHSGTPFYYLLALILGLSPWSVFLGLTGWQLVREPSGAAAPERSAARFLLCWCGVYVLFFSLAGTKLPNYILPLFPAAALLTARFLEQWRCGEIEPPAWATTLSVACLALLGVGLAAGLLVAGGVVATPFGRVRALPALTPWALLGLIPLVAAGLATALLRRGRRTGVVAVVVGCAFLLTGALSALAAAAVEGSKAPRALAASLPADQTRRDVRVATLGYSQPSLVFYCQRTVRSLDREQDAIQFLDASVPSYLVLPAAYWEQMRARAPQGCRELGRRYDMYAGWPVVLIANAGG